jgi:threonyl-tRNA synthetase
LEYIGSDNQKHRPVMIHRAPFGSMERFVAVLLEHTGGNLPLWLTPEQAVVLPISEKYIDYAKEVVATLDQHDIRVTVDDRNEKTGKKIRDAELNKTPYMLIVGEKEMNDHSLAVRQHGQVDLGTMPIADFVEHINQKIKQELSEF